MRKVGITTTVPAEIIYSAKAVPVDLNNVFITDDDPNQYVDIAEIDGYPRNLCGWIKGIYGVVIKNDIREVIAVTQGDCSNTHALMETLQLKGVKVIPFAFPYDQDRKMLKLQLERLCEHLGTTWREACLWHKKLHEVRKHVWELDRLSWQENKVTGFENHLYQVSCSDFNGDPDGFTTEIKELLAKVKKRKPFTDKLRLGFMGVPPIFTDIYQYLEGLGARIVYNEVQRQFTMPFPDADLIEQYLRYTYPYHVFARISDIEAAVKERQLDGIIHYVQSFCFRQIEDLIFREKLDVPVLTLEGERAGVLDARSKMRLDAFIEMLG